MPAVALLGARQVGKTTLALDLASSWPNGALYLDLERPADRVRLDDADAFLRSQHGLVVLDEVHRAPELFAVLRGVIDQRRRAGSRTGQFLLLGSGGPHLVGAATESLAGRVAYIDLEPIDIGEAAAAGIAHDDVWLRGGFPDSLLASDDQASFDWRIDFIRTYLERDVPLFAPRVARVTLERLWTMLAHGSGGLLNASDLARSLAVSSPTVGRYLDLLEQLGLVRQLQPWHANLGKRLTKRPKVYLRDTGLLHALLRIPDLHTLLGHPVVGASYETLAIESLLNAAANRWEPYFYRTATGAEMDLVLVRAGHPEIGVEIKRSTAPTTPRGFAVARQDLGLPRTFVAHPGPLRYRRTDGTEVIPLPDLVELLAAEADNPPARLDPPTT
jgi:uncharacterized protein